MVKHYLKHVSKKCTWDWGKQAGNCMQQRNVYGMFLLIKEACCVHRFTESPLLQSSVMEVCRAWSQCSCWEVGNWAKCMRRRGKKNRFLHRKCVPKVLMHTAEVKEEWSRATSPPASVENKAGIVWGFLFLLLKDEPPLLALTSFCKLWDSAWFPVYSSVRMSKSVRSNNKFFQESPVILTKASRKHI